MKTHTLISTLAALLIAIATPSFVATAQTFGGGPGIAMAGSTDISQLPAKAKSFIDKHFKGIAIRTCEKYYAKGTYEVELVNGLDIEFNAKGDVIEIDAPDNTVLAAKVVKEVLPHSAYSRLEKDGMLNYVESIEFNRGKVYEVDLRISGPDTYVFDPSGIFIAIED